MVTIKVPTAISGISRAQNKRFYRSTRLTPPINLIDTGQLLTSSTSLSTMWGISRTVASINSARIKETLVNEGLTPATQTNFEDGWISG